MLTAVVSTNKITADASGGSIAVSLTQSAIQTTANGGAGPAGSSIGASLATLSDTGIVAPTAGDLLRHDGALWRNYSEEKLTDGGNF